MDELEKKKWLISRIDIVFNVQRNRIKEKEKKFEKFQKDEVNRWKNLEKGIISAIVIISGIIFGINSIDHTIPKSLDMALATISAGVLIYLITLVFRNRNEDIFDEIVHSNKLSDAWYYCYDYFNTCAIKLEDWSVNDFEKLLEYFNSYTIISSELSLYITLKKINRSYLKVLFLSSPAIKKIVSNTNSIKFNLDMKSEHYNNEKQNFENTAIFQSILLYGNALTRYKNGILIHPDPLARAKTQTELKKKNDMKK